MKAAIVVTTSFETMGWLVYKRIAPFDLVLDLVGGFVVSMNRKLHRVHQDLRKTENQPSWAEWFEWLSNQVSKEKNLSDSAYIRHRDWKSK